MRLGSILEVAANPTPWLVKLELHYQHVFTAAAVCVIQLAVEQVGLPDRMDFYFAAYPVREAEGNLLAPAMIVPDTGMMFVVIGHLCCPFPRIRPTHPPHPFIDLGGIELPQPPDAMRGKALVVDPAVDGIARDDRVLGDLSDGYLRLGHGMPQQRRLRQHKVLINRKESNLAGKFLSRPWSA